MRVRFWGTRGLLATPGHAYQRYGGATVCVELVSSEGTRLVVDLGTGCIPLGASLMADAAKGGTKKLAVLLSATRIDHIHGLPFFAPALVPGWDLSIMGPSQAGQDISAVLDGSLNPNYSPLYGVGNLTPQLSLTTLTEGELSWGGFRILTRELPHGQTRALGFRIEADGGIVALVPDVEYEDGDPHPAALDLASEADILVHDGMESVAAVVKRLGTGPKPPLDALLLAREAGAKRLFLYHHDPDLDDVRMDALLAKLAPEARGVALDAAKAGEDVDVRAA